MLKNKWKKWQTKNWEQVNHRNTKLDKLTTREPNVAMNVEIDEQKYGKMKD